VKMGLFLITGGSIGGVLGTYIIKCLREMGNVDFVIKISYVFLLSIIGGFMFYDGIRLLHRKNKSAPKPPKENRFLQLLPLRITFPRSGIRMSIILPIALGLVVGIMAAIMGVGGGFLMVPAMIYGLRMPLKMVVGTSLFQIMLTSIVVTVMQASINQTVDTFLAISILLGSAIGAQVGARLGQHISGQQLKILLAIIVLVVSGKMLIDLLTAPTFLLSPLGGR